MQVEQVERPEKPYLGVRGTVAMDAIPALVDQAFPKIFAWAAEHGVAPKEAPFIKYNRYDADGTMQMDCGIVLDTALENTPEGFVSGILPAGLYASTLHKGPFDGLRHTTEKLVDWGREQAISWEGTHDATGGEMACHLEIYHTDPSAEPDPSRWVTEIALKIAQ